MQCSQLSVIPGTSSIHSAFLTQVTSVTDRHTDRDSAVAYTVLSCNVSRSKNQDQLVPGLGGSCQLRSNAHRQ